MTGVNQYISGMPTGSGPLTRALVATLLLGIGLTACVPFGTDQGPTRRATASPSVPAPGATSGSGLASSTPTSAAPTTLPTWGPLPDGVAPARPGALDQPPTLDGAKAVAVYFLLLVPYGFQTGDLAAWQSMSHPDCVFCASVVSNVKEQFARGERTEGSSLQVQRLGGTEVDLGRFFNVTATIREAPSQTLTAAGAVVEKLSAATTDVDLVVLHEGGAWTVREVSYEASK